MRRQKTGRERQRALFRRPRLQQERDELGVREARGAIGDEAFTRSLLFGEVDDSRASELERLLDVDCHRVVSMRHAENPSISLCQPRTHQASRRSPSPDHPDEE